MSGTEQIRPLPRQAVAMACPAFELMFGGQKGGSKTFFLLLCWALILQRASERSVASGRPQAHVRIVIFRKNLRDLKDIIIKSHRVFTAIDPNAAFNQNEKLWRFSSGATVEFAHLDGPEDHRGWNGQEIMGLGLDQVEEIPFEVYSFLVAQVRTSDEHYKDLLMVRSTANPGGKHGDWVKRYFIDPHPPGNRIITTDVENSDGQVKSVTKAFIPSALRDNPYLYDDGQYEARLRATLPDHLLKMYLGGDWNVVQGAFFASRIRPDKHFRDSFAIPSSWQVGFGLDWGSTAPAATIFVAKDPDDRVYAIDEFYEPGDRGRKYGERLLGRVKRQQWSAEKKWAVEEFWGAIDSQAMGNYGSEGGTAADGIASWGFRLFPANKDRRTGIEQIFERLAIRADGRPGLIIFKDRCPNLVRTLQTVRVNPRDPEDYDIDDESHAIDGLRFILQEWPVWLGASADLEDESVRRWETVLREQRRKSRSGTVGISTGYDG